MSIAWCFRAPPSRGASNESSSRMLSPAAIGKYSDRRWATVVASEGAAATVASGTGLAAAGASARGDADCVTVGADGVAGITRQGARWEQAVEATSAAKARSRAVVMVLS